MNVTSQLSQISLLMARKKKPKEQNKTTFSSIVAVKNFVFSFNLGENSPQCSPGWGWFLYVWRWPWAPASDSQVHVRPRPAEKLLLFIWAKPDLWWKEKVLHKPKTCSKWGHRMSSDKKKKKEQNKSNKKSKRQKQIKRQQTTCRQKKLKEKRKLCEKKPKIEPTQAD